MENAFWKRWYLWEMTGISLDYQQLQVATH